MMRKVAALLPISYFCTIFGFTVKETALLAQKLKPFIPWKDTFIQPLGMWIYSSSTVVRSGLEGWGTLEKLMLATSPELCDLSKVPQHATKLIDQSVVINHSQLAKRLKVGAQEINPASFLVEVSFDCFNSEQNASHPLSNQKHTIAPCDASSRKLECVCFKWKLSRRSRPPTHQH